MFGQSSQQKPNIFGSFGATNTTTPTTTGTTTGATTGTGTGTGTGFSLFGNTANKPATTTTNIFGTPATGTGTGTGTGTTGGLFGSTTNQGTTGTGTGTGTGTTNIFGAASETGSTNTTGTGTGGGLFGSTTAGTTNQPATGGGLFGQPANTTPATTNIFGQPAQNTTTGTGTTTNIFGQPSTTTTSGMGTGTGLFGQPSTNTTTTGTSAPTNLFGSTTQTQQQQQPKPSLFGATTTTQSPFTSSQLNPNASTTAGTKPSVGMFGSTLGASTAPSRLAASFAPIHEPTLQERIENVYKAWDTNSSDGGCKFQHWFFNYVDPSTINQYQTKPSGSNVDAAKWEKAMRDNPDPSCLVPVLALGFDDLQKRATAQTETTTTHTQTLTKLRDTLTSLSQAHTLQNTLRLQRLELAQLQIRQRLMKLIVHLHLIIPTVRGSAIRPEEEKLRSTLEGIDEELRRFGGNGSGRVGGDGYAGWPGGANEGIGRMRALMNELWAGVEQVQAMKRRERGLMGNGGNGGGDGSDWQVVDKAGLQRIANVLLEEQQGLAYITKLLQDNAKALEVIEEATKQVALQQAHGPSQKRSASGYGQRSASGLSTSFLLGR